MRKINKVATPGKATSATAIAQIFQKPKQEKKQE
jgi:hypothetical protein